MIWAEQEEVRLEEGVENKGRGRGMRKRRHRGFEGELMLPLSPAYPLWEELRGPLL